MCEKIDRWINKWMNEWMNKWMNGRIYKTETWKNCCGPWICLDNWKDYFVMIAMSFKKIHEKRMKDFDWPFFTMHMAPKLQR